MKSRRSYVELDWLLKQTASQFLVKPTELRNAGRHAWRVAARDAFCLVAAMFRLGSQRDIADFLGCDPSTISDGIKRGRDMYAQAPLDLVTLAVRSLSDLTSRAKIYGTGSFSRFPENPLKTPPKAVIAPPRGGPTRRPPSRASNPRPIAACRDSSRPLTSSSPK
jgi:hypothetical protein